MMVIVGSTERLRWLCAIWSEFPEFAQIVDIVKIAK